MHDEPNIHLPRTPVTRSAWLTAATARLRAAEVDAPRLSAELVLREVLGLDRLTLALHPDEALPEAALPALCALLERRRAGEPVAYLLGRREFYGRDFAVNASTLIPRPETEHLVEAALAGCSAAQARFADLGTGSGCIAVTLCLERPGWRGLAADLSASALAVAAANAARHGVRERLGLVRADFTRPLLADATLDVCVSNPPYVSLAEYQTLSPEVRDFEPCSALVPEARPAPCAEDPHGLAHLFAVAVAAERLLKPGGLLVMEHGSAQGPALRLWLENNTWDNIATYHDLAGHERGVSARRRCVQQVTVA